MILNQIDQQFLRTEEKEGNLRINGNMSFVRINMDH